MDETKEKLLKELLQKKLHGTLTPQEDAALTDLAMRKKYGDDYTPPMSSSTMPSDAYLTTPPGLHKLMGEMDSLSSSMDEMANKVTNRSAQAEAKDILAEYQRKMREGK